MGKDLSDYVMVRDTYLTPDGVALPKGTILHRNHPYTNHALCDPVNVIHDVETATAEPGEKRRTKVTRTSED